MNARLFIEDDATLRAWKLFAGDTVVCRSERCAVRIKEIKPRWRNEIWKPLDRDTRLKRWMI